jgi:hypothetical protein
VLHWLRRITKGWRRKWTGCFVCTKVSSIKIFLSVAEAERIAGLA